MKFDPGDIYHVYNQGNNKQVIFFDDADYECFLNLTSRSLANEVETIAYCLMPNHFHLMIEAREGCKQQIKQGNLTIDSTTNAIRRMLSGFTRISNQKYHRSGSLFRQKTKAKNLSELGLTRDYYFYCFHYIHQNPLRAGLVSRLEDWKYSSFLEYAGLTERRLASKDAAKRILGYRPDIFIKESYELLGDDRVKNYEFR